MEDELYYIQNVGYCGNCLRWWKPNGHGYTMNLNEAWKLNSEQADRICKSRPKEDIRHLVSLIDKLSERHLNCEALRSHSKLEKDGD